MYFILRKVEHETVDYAILMKLLTSNNWSHISAFILCRVSTELIVECVEI